MKAGPKLCAPSMYLTGMPQSGQIAVFLAPSVSGCVCLTGMPQSGQIAVFLAPSVSGCVCLTEMISLRWSH